MTNQTDVKGEFSPVSGHNTRRCYNVKTGSFIGLIIKVKQGYEVRRFPDGKVRVKKTLAAAFASIKRSN